MALANVIYTWTAHDGRPLRVGRTPWRRWAGWEQCHGACTARRRTEHRFCEEYLTLPKWARLRLAVDWERGAVHSRRPIAGRVTWRLVLGHGRTVALERATIQALRPRFNVQHGPARPARRRRAS